MQKSLPLAAQPRQPWALYDLKGVARAKGTERPSGLTILLFLMGITLNQSIVMFNANLSGADLFSLFLAVYLLGKRAFKVYKPALFLFLLIGTTTLLTAYFFVPGRFGFTPTLQRALVGYVKLVAALIYLFFGINLSRLGQIDRLWKYFSWAALAIGASGLVFSFVRIPAVHEVLFYGEVRFRGLMNDPNYFSIIQNVAIVYFLRTEDVKESLRPWIIAILIYSAISSGSKTGVITLILSFLLIYTEKFIRDKRNFKSVLRSMRRMLTLPLGFFLLYDHLQILVNRLARANASFRRIQEALLDFDQAVSGGGSGRIDTWRMAVHLIEESPILGIGVGTYTGITEIQYNYGAIAHNTYLQLGAEWGLPLALFFFSLLLYTFLRALFSNRAELLMPKNMLFVFLIGSFAVSLNNARIFWIIFGSILYHLSTKDAGKGAVRHG